MVWCKGGGNNIDLERQHETFVANPQAATLMKVSTTWEEKGKIFHFMSEVHHHMVLHAGSPCFMFLKTLSQVDSIYNLQQSITYFHASPCHKVQSQVLTKGVQNHLLVTEILPPQAIFHPPPPV